MKDLWLPPGWIGDSCWQDGQEYVYQNGILVPASCAPKTGWLGMTWTTAPMTALPADIVAAIEKASEDMQKTPNQDGFLSYVGLMMKSIQTSMGIPAPVFASADILPPWWGPSYDIHALPENPRVVLHRHPRAISDERARVICGGSLPPDAPAGD